MIQKEIYIIRHGQTEHNALGIVQGKGVNLSLNNTGYQQAECFYNYYRQIPFEAIYTSTLKRAQESVARFTANGIPTTAFSELDEISWGNLEGLHNTLESDAAFQQLLVKWRNGDEHAKASPNAESPYELQQRQNTFVDFLRSTPHSKILIATHGRFIRAFMCTLTGLPLSNMEKFNHANLCLYKVNLLTTGEFSIELNCSVEHLKGM